MSFVPSKIKLTTRSSPNIARKSLAGNAEHSYLFVDGQVLSQRAFNDYDPKFVLQTFGDDFSYFRRLLFVCVGSVELIAKTKSNKVFLISSSLRSKQKFSGNICPPPVFPISNLDGFHIFENTAVFQFEDAKNKKLYAFSPGRTSLHERGD